MVMMIKIETTERLEMVNMIWIRSDEGEAGATKEGVYSRDEVMHDGMND